MEKDWPFASERNERSVRLMFLGETANIQIDNILKIQYGVMNRIVSMRWFLG